MSVEFGRGSPGKFDSRTLSTETLSRWTGRSFISRLNDIRISIGSVVVCHSIVYSRQYIVHSIV